MSQKCHEATRTEAFAPAFRAGRFPGFPKKSPPCRQWIGNENPRRDLGARDRRSPLRRRMSRIAKGHAFGPAVKNKCSRRIAKGGGLRPPFWIASRALKSRLVL